MNQDYVYILKHQPYREQQHWVRAFSLLEGNITFFLPKKYPPRYLYRYEVSWEKHRSPKPTQWDIHHIHLLSGPGTLASYYLLEWIITFIPERHPHPELFRLLAEALIQLEHHQNMEDIERALRVYERRAFNALGYGLSLEHIEHIDHPYISYHPTQGYQGHDHPTETALPKATLAAILSDNYTQPEQLKHAKKWFQIIVHMLLPHHQWKCKALYT